MGSKVRRPRHNRYGIFFTFLLLSANSICYASATGSFSFQVGNLYANIGGGISEYSPTLALIGTVQLFPANVVTEGVVFDKSGNLVLSVEEPGSSLHILELNSSGSIMHDVKIPVGGLNRDCEAAVDSSGNIFEALNSGVIRISPDFTTVTNVQYAFGRAAGLTIGPNGLLYATDQSSANLITFNSALQPQTIVSTYEAPQGLGFDSSGRLLLGEYNYGNSRLDQINPVFGSETLVSQGESTDIVGAADGSYYVTEGGAIDRFSSNDVLLQAVQTPVFTDSIALDTANVPEPSALLITIIGMGSQLRRHRTRG